VYRRKKIISLFFVLISVTFIHSFSQTPTVAFLGLDTLYELQKRPDELGNAREQFLRTLTDQPQLLDNEETVEALGYRIYYKLKLLQTTQDKTPLLIALLKEDTDGVLAILRDQSSDLGDYSYLYPLMGFLEIGFRRALSPFDFETMTPYFNISKFRNFENFFSLTNEEHFYISKAILEGFVKNEHFAEPTLKQMVALLGEKYLRAYATQLLPYTNQRSEGDYLREYRLIKSYIDQATYLYGSETTQLVNKDILTRWVDLSGYLSCNEDTIISEKRISSVSEEIWISMLPIIYDIILRFEGIKTNKSGLLQNVVSLITTYGQRIPIISSELSDEINEKWRRFLQENACSPEIVKAIETAVFTPGTDGMEKAPVIKPVWKGWYFFPLIITGVCILIFLFLPITIKSKLYTKLGFREKALSLYQKIAILKPQVADYHVKMALLLESLHREEEAIQEYRIATKIIEMHDKTIPKKKGRRD
jgi:tetratricopeptide (TPR) repeat protein